MKEPWEKKAEGMASGQKDWYQHLANCIASEQCPHCGEDIFVNEEILDKTSRKTLFFQCSACSWKNT
jgi:hypothetical protein